ncbi:hypothetical protein D9611_001278 [Ephemerocybe angulata]|uniref:F-box domain-containing protein n=1 Tax=Ephemerocybe angulata TaxID=980116 RepID=A0A8H5CJF5_9AGAR|nr:hypothetical protein D9611_001278 [Tulosesus angulatus]
MPAGYKAAPAFRQRSFAAMWSASTQKLFEDNGKISVQKYRQLIQSRVHELESETLALKTLHNTLSTTNSLPPEILSTIFRLVQISAQRQGESLSWIRLTHVCRHWRAVSLSCASLWSQIAFENPFFTDVMLARSSNAPLDVHFDVPSPSKKPLAYHALRDVLQSQVHRLRSVTIQSSGSAHRLHFPKLLSKWTAAPILEELRLHATEGDPLRLPFLRKGAPSLKHLELSGFRIPDWMVLPLGPTLETLEIAFSSEVLAGAPLFQRPTAQALFSTLQRAPSLGKLRLFSTLPRIPTAGEPHTTPIVCRNLRELHLGDTPIKILNFFQAVHAPQLRNLHITFDDQVRDTVPLLADFLDTLASTRNFPASPSIIEFKIEHAGLAPVHNFTFQFAGTSPQADDAYTLQLSHIRHRNHDLEDLLPLFTNLWDVSELRSLAIDSDDWIGSSSWNLHFRNLQKLEHIEIVGGSIRGFIHSLRDGLLLDEQSPEPDLATGSSGEELILIPLPALSTIVVEEVELPPDLLVQFMEVLGVWVELDTPPLKISFYQCEAITRETFGALVEALPGIEFSWDGFTLGDSYTDL